MSFYFVMTTIRVTSNFTLFILFLHRMLKSLIVPLLVSSITCAIGSLDLKMSGKIAKRYDGNANRYDVVLVSQKKNTIFLAFDLSGR